MEIVFLKIAPSLCVFTLTVFHTQRETKVVFLPKIVRRLEIIKDNGIK